jgi:hypothetical protein
MPSNSKFEGTLEWTREGVVTRHGAKSSGIKFNTGMRIPALLDNELMRVKWNFTPLKLGGYGQDFRTMQGPLVVELNRSGATLNTKQKSSAEIKEGENVVFSCDFNRDYVYSWKINGVEQLTKPIPAWMKGATDLVAYLIDWSGAKSETLWKSLDVSYIPRKAGNSLDALLASWSNFPMVRNGEKSSFILAHANSMTKVFREAADFKGECSSLVRLHTAANERESFQIVLIPLGGRTLVDVDFEPTKLLRIDKGAEIKAANVVVNPVGYVKTRSCVSAAKRIGWEWPDVILPTASKVKVEPGRVQPFWCTISTPPNAKPGIYRGFIKVECGSAGSRMLRIELKVAPYSLPLHGALKTCFGFPPHYWDAWQKPRKCRKLLGIGEKAPIPWGSRKLENVLSKKEKKRIFDFAADYRISLTDLYCSPRDFPDYRTFPANPSEVNYCHSKGMNVMNLGYMDEWGMMAKPEVRERFLRNLERKLRKWEPFVKKAQWKDFDWILHCFDESATHEAKRVKIVGAFMKLAITRLKRQFPWLKFETANPYMKKYASLFDIWTVTTGDLRKDKNLYDKLLAAGKEEIWGYTTNGSVKEANFMLDYPGLYPRIMPWQFFQRRIKGLLYFEVDCYHHQKNAYKQGVKWPKVSWNPLAFHANSDGILFYPGPGGEPLASTRLANLRDGIEDYEALVILNSLRLRLESAGIAKQLLKKVKRHLAVPKIISKSFSDFTKEPSVLDDARKKTDELIELCSKALGDGK